MKRILSFLFGTLLLCQPAFAINWQSGFDSGALNANQVKADTTNFSKNLSSADSDVQHALNTLDQLTTGSGNVGIGTVGRLAVYTASTTVRGLGTPSLCSAGQYATGIDSSGNATGCTVVSSGQWITNGTIGIGTYSNVGIGTITPSTSTLTVIGNIGIGTLAGDGYLTTGPPNGGLIAYGNIGVGTWTPTSQLSIQGATPVAGITINSANVPSTCGASQVALLHLDGANAGTSFPDANCDGSGAKTFTAAGNAQTSTAQIKFGTASLLLDGTGDYITNATDTYWLTGTNSFTYEVWVYPVSSIGSEGLMGYNTSTNNYWSLYIDSTNIYFINRNAAVTTISFNGTHGMSINNWYDIVLQRNGNNFNISVNGVSVASTSNASTITTSAGGTFRLGESIIGAGFSDFNGYMDEFRDSNSAQYAFPFTPQTAAFSAAGGVTSTTYQIAGTTYFSTGIDKNSAFSYKISNGNVSSNDRVVVTTGGNVGISSISPGALLDIAGNMRLATGGFLISQQATAPTVANNDCGTTVQGTVAANSTDLLGTMTVGTLAVTSCAMTFNKTHAVAPICFCQDDTSVLAVKCTATTTKLTVVASTSASSDVVAYWCPTNLP